MRVHLRPLASPVGVENDKGGANLSVHVEKNAGGKGFDPPLV